MTIHQNLEFTETIMSQFPLDEAVVWIARELDPEDVFSEKKLEAWAKANGFKEKE